MPKCAATYPRGGQNHTPIVHIWLIHITFEGKHHKTCIRVCSIWYNYLLNSVLWWFTLIFIRLIPYRLDPDYVRKSKRNRVEQPTESAESNSPNIAVAFNTVQTRQPIQSEIIRRKNVSPNALSVQMNMASSSSMRNPSENASMLSGYDSDPDERYELMRQKAICRDYVEELLSRYYF